MTFATQQTQNTLESGDSEHVLLEFEKSFMQMINVKLEKMWFVISSIVEATLLYLSDCIFFSDGTPSPNQALRGFPGFILSIAHYTDLLNTPLVISKIFNNFQPIFLKLWM